MPFKTQSGICITHSDTIVNYLNECFSGIFHYQFDLRSASVDGVLKQFFLHRSRALYHFSGSNLISNMIGQQPYDIRHYYLGKKMVKSKSINSRKINIKIRAINK